ncbi:MAG TPA: zinc ribbon domain-containing protein [Methylococcaceae bacterium]|nr:zinc ribbon domain-containing protein [Methylococcaceae bacterium]
MPVYVIHCQNCRHVFQGMVFAGSQEPKIWVCSKCGGRNAKPYPEQKSVSHPLEDQHGSGCPCCR